jgi:hypothetical protein
MLREPREYPLLRLVSDPIQVHNPAVKSGDARAQAFASGMLVALIVFLGGCSRAVGTARRSPHHAESAAPQAFYAWWPSPVCRSVPPVNGFGAWELSGSEKFFIVKASGFGTDVIEVATNAEATQSGGLLVEFPFVPTVPYYVVANSQPFEWGPFNASDRSSPGSAPISGLPSITICGE